jgi:hypothetical protein
LSLDIVSNTAWRLSNGVDVPDALDGNEASRVHGAEVVEGIHRRLLLRVQLLGGAGTAQYVGVTLVQLEADLTVDTALREQQTVLDELALRRKVHAVVQLVAPVVTDELVAQVAHLSVHDKTLEVQVRKAEDRHGGRVIAATALKTNEAVLNNVDATNTVCVAELVQRDEELDRVGVSLLGGDELNGDTLLEVNGDVSGLVGSVQRALSHGPHVIRRGDIGVLEDTCPRQQSSTVE